jgi:drug/metabolite transporter (DMT)-like permease
VRFSNRELAPLWGASLRFALAVAVLGLVVAALRIDLPRGRALTGAVLYGLFTFGLAFGLFYYALVSIRAGLGQTVLALVPLATLIVAVLWRQERLRARAVIGSLLALAGVAVMSGGPLRAGVPVISVLALLASALSFAQGAVLVRHFPPVHPVAINAVGMAAGAALLLVAALIVGEPLALPHDAVTWGAVGYVAVVGSVLVFTLYVFVLGRWSASRASYQLVLTPFVTVFLSAWLDDERIGFSLIVGGLLVLLGVYVGALRADDDGG